MTPIKRVEIVTDTLELQRVLEILDRAGVSGYTTIRDAAGRGDRGTRAGDELTDVFKNSYVLAACTAEQSLRVVEGLRPLLKVVGGICLVSDAQWVIH